jgi:hypothetical protein
MSTSDKLVNISFLYSHYLAVINEEGREVSTDTILNLKTCNNEITIALESNNLIRGRTNTRTNNPVTGFLIVNCVSSQPQKY